LKNYLSKTQEKRVKTWGKSRTGGQYTGWWYSTSRWIGFRLIWLFTFYRPYCFVVQMNLSGF